MLVVTHSLFSSGHHNVQGVTTVCSAVIWSKAV